MNGPCKQALKEQDPREIAGTVAGKNKETREDLSRP
jgi:hypothetical protein